MNISTTSKYIKSLATGVLVATLAISTQASAHKNSDLGQHTHSYAQRHTANAQHDARGHTEKDRAQASKASDHHGSPAVTVYSTAGYETGGSIYKTSGHSNHHYGHYNHYNYNHYNRHYSHYNHYNYNRSSYSRKHYNRGHHSSRSNHHRSNSSHRSLKRSHRR